MKIRAFSILFLLGFAVSAMPVFAGGLQWKSPVKNNVSNIETAVDSSIPSNVSPTVSLAVDEIPAGEFCAPTDSETMPVRAATAHQDSRYPILLVQYTETKPENIPPAPRLAENIPIPAQTMVKKPVAKSPCNADLKSIQDISHDIRLKKSAELPEECGVGVSGFDGRNFSQTCYQWKASNLCTKGAYFEDVQLERYGHSVCPTLQPVISGAKFFATIPLLPYYMGVNPPDECVYTLGHYRVGSCSPYMVQPFPISLRGALFEAGAVGGAIAVFP